MIPHTLGAPSLACGLPMPGRRCRQLPPETRESPASATPCTGGRSTELSSNESRNGTTELAGLGEILRLRQNPHHRLCARGTDEHSAAVSELAVDTFDLREQARRKLTIGRGHALLHLRVARENSRGFAQRSTLQRTTKKKRSGESVSGDVVAEIDDVPGLLAPEDAAAAAQSLEDVTIADIGCEHSDAALAHQPVEAEVRHHRDRDELDLQVESEDRENLVAVDGVAACVDGKHAVAVPVEGDSEVVTSVDDDGLKEREVGRPAADVDVVPVGVGSNRLHLGAQPLERLRRDS